MEKTMANIYGLDKKTYEILELRAIEKGMTLEETVKQAILLSLGLDENGRHLSRKRLSVDGRNIGEIRRYKCPHCHNPVSKTPEAYGEVNDGLECISVYASKYLSPDGFKYLNALPGSNAGILALVSTKVKGLKAVAKVNRNGNLVNYYNTEDLDTYVLPTIKCIEAYVKGINSDDPLTTS